MPRKRRHKPQASSEPRRRRSEQPPTEGVGRGLFWMRWAHRFAALRQKRLTAWAVRRAWPYLSGQPFAESWAAQMWARAGCMQEAVAAYCQAEGLTVGSTREYGPVGLWLCEEGLLEPARLYLKQALDAGDQDLEVLKNFCRLEVMRLFEAKAVRLEQSLPRDQAVKGDSVQRSEWQQLSVRTRELVKRAPRYADGHALLGICLAGCGQFQEAEACWRTMERLAPEDGDLTLLVKLALAQARHADGIAHAGAGAEP